MKTWYFVPAIAVFSAIAPQSAAPAAENTSAGTLTAEIIVARLVEMDQSRAAALNQYTSQRRYVAENPRFSQRAEVSVEESYAAPGKKEFRILSESGSLTARHRVIDKLMQAEVEAARPENRGLSHVSPQNYTFRLVGGENKDGRSCFVLEVTPKVPKKYLMRGRIWVDDKEFAIVRMEGSPAVNPSFWTRRATFVRRYEKHDRFWLPASLDSESDLLIAGRSFLRIEYFGYRITGNAEALGGPATPTLAEERTAEQVIP